MDFDNGGLDNDNDTYSDVKNGADDTLVVNTHDQKAQRLAKAVSSIWDSLQAYMHKTPAEHGEPTHTRKKKTRIYFILLPLGPHSGTPGIEVRPPVLRWPGGAEKVGEEGESQSETVKNPTSPHGQIRLI